MARNIEKQKIMILRALVFLSISFGLSVFSSAAGKDLPQATEFMLLYSANVNGELEGCG